MPIMPVGLRGLLRVLHQRMVDTGGRASFYDDFVGVAETLTAIQNWSGMYHAFSRYTADGRLVHEIRFYGVPGEDWPPPSP